MNPWRKLTIDWPCAAGDWLWDNLVVAPAAFLDRLTLRGVARFALQIALFAVLIAFFQQIIALDLSFLFYVDAGFYLDLFAAVFVLVAREGLSGLFAAAARLFRLFTPALPKLLPRFGARQNRNAGVSRRKKDGGPKPSDDEPAGVWSGYALAA